MPTLEAFFVRDATGNIVAALGPDEPTQPIARAKVLTFAAPVLVNARREMRRDADIHRTAIAISHDVNPAALPRSLH
jgi:hypothetical protein